MATVFGYCRCSTNETKQDVKRQERELRAAGADLCYMEYISGTAEKKPEWEKLLAALRPGDTLLVTEVSRLTRSMKQLLAILDLAQERQIRLQVLNSITVDCRSEKPDPMTRAFLQMSGVFSELERELTRERVVSGMANARANGKQIGRPAMAAGDLPTAFWRLRDMLTQKKVTKTEMARALDVSRPTLDRWLKCAGK